MGIMDFIKGQFIEVIEWLEIDSEQIVYRFPVGGNEIKMGAQLTVRETQLAIFVNEGVIADIFEPGRYILNTQNMPILTKLKAWKYGFNSPFKAEVYFVNTKQFLDQKWGTTNPVMMRDREFGMIRLRGYGTFAYRVTDPRAFMMEILGTQGAAGTDDLTPQVKIQIVSALSDFLGESGIQALDLAMHYDEISLGVKVKVEAIVTQYGIGLTNLTVENLSLPLEVEAVMDKRTSMGVLGNLDQYTKYQAAEALREAARNEGGGFAAMGAGLGAGAGLAGAMTGAMSGAFTHSGADQAGGSAGGNAGGNAGASGAAAGVGVVCPKCSNMNPAGSKFCASCGQNLEVQAQACFKCGSNVSLGAKFCPNCGQDQSARPVCPKCQAEVVPGAKFCGTCGEAL
jgi:membrane protease subunit (stomatin/prohibitin family)